MIFAYTVLSVLAAYAVVMSLILASRTEKTPPPSTSGTAVFAMAWYLWSVIGLWAVIHMGSLAGSAWVVAVLLGLSTPTGWGASSTPSASPTAR